MRDAIGNRVDVAMWTPAYSSDRLRGYHCQKVEARGYHLGRGYRFGYLTGLKRPRNQGFQNLNLSQFAATRGSQDNS